MCVLLILLIVFVFVFVLCYVTVLFSIILLFFFLFVSPFFFFKQKTAYEMRISDWSSDVCSSDLLALLLRLPGLPEAGGPGAAPAPAQGGGDRRRAVRRVPAPPGAVDLGDRAASSASQVLFRLRELSGGEH